MRVGEGKGGFLGLPQLVWGSVVGCFHLSWAAGSTHSFIHLFTQHSFIEHLLCASPSSRTWGFSCEQTKGPCFDQALSGSGDRK